MCGRGWKPSATWSRPRPAAHRRSLACGFRRAPGLARWEERPETPCGRFVRAMNLDPVLDWSLCDGAVRCLQLVLSLAGGAGRPFATLTSSIAKQLGRTARTVQNYWNELADSGVIKRTFDRKTGMVTVTATTAVAPPAAPEKPAVWPRLPSPKVVFRRALTKGGCEIRCAH
jgi:hypothetical protein